MLEPFRLRGIAAGERQGPVGRPRAMSRAKLGPVRIAAVLPGRVLEMVAAGPVRRSASMPFGAGDEGRGPRGARGGFEEIAQGLGGDRQKHRLVRHERPVSAVTVTAVGQADAGEAAGVLAAVLHLCRRGRVAGPRA